MVLDILNSEGSSWTEESKQIFIFYLEQIFVQKLCVISCFVIRSDFFTDSHDLLPVMIQFRVNLKTAVAANACKINFDINSKAGKNYFEAKKKIKIIIWEL